VVSRRPAADPGAHPPGVRVGRSQLSGRPPRSRCEGRGEEVYVQSALSNSSLDPTGFAGRSATESLGVAKMGDGRRIDHGEHSTD